MNKEVQVELASKTITVRKLPIGKYAELLKGLEKLPQMIEQISTLSEQEVIKELPTLIVDFLPEFAFLISVCTNGQLTREEVENEVGLDDAVEILTAAYQLNVTPRLVDMAKKLMARKQKATTIPTPKTPKT